MLSATGWAWLLAKPQNVVNRSWRQENVTICIHLLLCLVSLIFGGRVFEKLVGLADSIETGFCEVSNYFRHRLLFLLVVRRLPIFRLPSFAPALLFRLTSSAEMTSSSLALALMKNGASPS